MCWAKRCWMRWRNGMGNIEGVIQHGRTPGVAFTPGDISNFDATDLGKDGREDKSRGRKSQGRRAEESS